VTEAEWRACTDPVAMLEHVREQAGDRKLRLFAVACCRHNWDALAQDSSRDAVEAAEQFADGEIDAAALRDAWGRTTAFTCESLARRAWSRTRCTTGFGGSVTISI